MEKREISEKAYEGMKIKIVTVVVVLALALTAVNAFMFASMMAKEPEDEPTDGISSEEYVQKSGDSMTGNLQLYSLYASGIINGDGSGLDALNADNITTGILDTSRFPSNIDVCFVTTIETAPITRAYLEGI